MTVAIAIARRELASLFFSPIAYVSMTIFLAVCGYLFWPDFTPGAPVAMRSLFESMVLLLVFIVPVLSMGSLSTEFDKGTFESLMTAPVSEVAVVAGKFLGALGYFLVLLAPTLVYVLLLALFGAPDPGPLLAGYLGIVLVGTLFLSIGLCCSSLTRSQVIAAVMASAILFLITIVPWFAAGNAILPDFWRAVIRNLVFHRYADFARGVIDLSHVVFFLASTAVFLFLTTKVLESRRWR